MNKISYYIIFVLCMVFISCGGDDGIGEDKNNGNANANSIEKSPYATHIEMPHLQAGNNYLLLVKSDSQIGVNFTIEWDCMKKAQRWTAFHWNKSNSYKGWDRNNWRNGYKFNGYGGDYDPFQPDPDIPANYRSELSDYSRSGYDRGHMCASEDRICSQNVNGQTFYLSNMHPQVNSFNGAVWATMESRVRNWRDATVNAGGDFYVCKGGTIYDNICIDGKTGQKGVLTTIGNSIPVPKYFFMAVLKRTASNTYSAMAFWAEHKSDSSRDLTPYMISVDELEKRTGYDFFCNLPDNIENNVESILTISEWK